MKAPDKIYIQQDMINNIPLEQKEFDDDVEYIRKNALLERLEEVASEYKKRSDEGELVWQNMCGINEAINILNEM